MRSNVLWGLILCAGLSACGGGGGDGGGGDDGGGGSASPATLSSSNSDAAASDSLEVAFYFAEGDGAASALVGVEGTNDPNLLAFAREQIRKAPRLIRQAPATAVGLEYADTYACSTSGSFTLSWNDADNDGDLSSGDSVALSFNNCVEGGVTATGSLSVVYNTYSASSTDPYVYSGSFTATFSNLRVSSGSSFQQGNGGMTFTVNSTGYLEFSETLTIASFTLSSNPKFLEAPSEFDLA